VRLGAVRDLIANTRRQHKLPAIGKLGLELALEAQKDVTLRTPVIRKVPGRILHHSHPDIAELPSSPIGGARFAFVLDPLDLGPIRRSERDF